MNTLIDKISEEEMLEPVVILTSGQTFNGPALKGWMKTVMAKRAEKGQAQQQVKKPYFCPNTNIPFGEDDLKVDKRLSDIVTVIEEIATSQKKFWDEIDYTKATKQQLKRLTALFKDPFNGRFIVTSMLLQDGNTIDESSSIHFKPGKMTINPITKEIMAQPVRGDIRNYTLEEVINEFLEIFPDYELYEMLEEALKAKNIALIEEIKKEYQQKNLSYEAALGKFAYQHYLAIKANTIVIEGERIQLVSDQRLALALTKMRLIAEKQNKESLEEIDYNIIDETVLNSLADCFKMSVIDTIFAKPVILEDGSTIEEEVAKKLNRNNYRRSGALAYVIKEFLKACPKYNKDLYLLQKEQDAIWEALKNKHKKTLEEFCNKYHGNGMFLTILKNYDLNNPPKKQEDYTLFFDKEKLDLQNALNLGDLNKIKAVIEKCYYGINTLFLPLGNDGKTALQIALANSKQKDLIASLIKLVEQSSNCNFKDELKSIKSQLKASPHLAPGFKGALFFHKTISQDPNAKQQAIKQFIMPLDPSEPARTQNLIFDTSNSLLAKAIYGKHFIRKFVEIATIYHGNGDEDETSTNSLGFGKNSISGQHLVKQVHFIGQAKGGVFIVYTDGKVRLVKMSNMNGKIKDSFSDKNLPDEILGSSVKTIICIPGTNFLIIGLNDGCIGIWDFESGTLLTHQVSPYPIQALCINEHGELVVSSGKISTNEAQLNIVTLEPFDVKKDIKLYNIATAVHPLKYKGREYLVLGYSTGIIQLWYEQEGQQKWLSLTNDKKYSTYMGCVRTIETKDDRIISFNNEGTLADVWKMDIDKDGVHHLNHLQRINLEEHKFHSYAIAEDGFFYLKKEPRSGFKKAIYSTHLDVTEAKLKKVSCAMQ